MSASSLQCWDWNWLPAWQQAVMALLTSVLKWHTTPSLGSSACETWRLLIPLLWSHAMRIQLPTMPQTPSKIASQALNSFTPQFLSSQKSIREIITLLFPSRMLHLLWFTCYRTDCLLLGLWGVWTKQTYPLNSPPAPSHRRTSSSFPNSVSYHNSNAMRIPAMQGMWRILLLGTNS